MRTVRKWTRDELEKVEMPSEAKRYLVESGIEYDDAGIFDFSHSGSVLSPYFLVGYNYDTPIVVSPTGSINFLEDGWLRFANSDVIKFAKTAKAFLDYQERVTEFEMHDEEKAMELVNQTKEEFARIDPKALESSEYVWAVIADQMRDAML